MTWTAKLGRVVPDLSATLARFPVPALVAVALCADWNLNGAGVSGDSSWQVIAGGAAGFVASGAAHLYAEGRGLSKLAGVLIAVAAGLALAALGYFTVVFETSLLFLFAGLIPVLMIAAYLRPGVRQGAIWLFNLRFGLAALLAFIVALIFALGLSSIVEALNFLFDAGLGSTLHDHIWGTAATLIGPVYGLSLMPRDLDEEIVVSGEKNALLERGVSVLVNYVLVPLVAVYAAILHAYAVKIAVQGELPRGQVATMVSIFALAGTAAWLVAWPWRESGTRLLRLFIGGWFFLTIIPVVLLGIAIWRRVADYGVTPDRYGIVLVAIWVAFITAYLAFRRNRADMRAILGGIAILLLVGAAGPFGANGLTISSQIPRLARLLVAAGVLKDGKVVTPPRLLPSAVVSQGYSILSALDGAGGLRRLAPWFADDAKNPFAGNDTGWALTGKIAERLGFSQTEIPADYVNFTASAPVSLAMTGGSRLVGPLQAMQNYTPNEPQPAMTARFDATTLTIKLDTAAYSVGLKELMAKTKAQLSTPSSIQPALAIDVAPGVTIAIDSIYGNLNATPPLGSMRFWVILK